MVKAEPDALAALTRARALIADPGHWTRSAPARAWRAPRTRGPGEWIPVRATDASASRWCAAGALCKVSGKRTAPPGIAFLEAAALGLLGVGIGRANDDRRFGHENILRCFDAAIAAAEAGEEPRRQRASA